MTAKEELKLDRTLDALDELLAKFSDRPELLQQLKEALQDRITDIEEVYEAD